MYPAVSEKCNQRWAQLLVRGAPLADIKEKVGKLSCKKCPGGRYSDAEGSPACMVCIPGRYAEWDEERASGSINCVNCPSGYFQEITAGDRCKECQVGYFSGYGAAVCVGCFKGRYGDEEALGGCKECLAGRFQSLRDQIECIDCPLGYSQIDNESSRCVSCVEGRFANEKGMFTCRLCPAGYSQVVIEQFGCDDCIPGRAQPTPGSSSCTSCLPGLFAAVDATQSCQNCPIGWSQPVAGNTSCTTCPPGKSSPEASRSCSTLPNHPLVGSAEFLSVEIQDTLDESSISSSENPFIGDLRVNVRESKINASLVDSTFLSSTIIIWRQSGPEGQFYENYRGIDAGNMSLGGIHRTFDIEAKWSILDWPLRVTLGGVLSDTSPIQPRTTTGDTLDLQLKFPFGNYAALCHKYSSDNLPCASPCRRSKEHGGVYIREA